MHSFWRDNTLANLQPFTQRPLPSGTAFRDTNYSVYEKIFHHSRISDADKTFLKNGVKWLNEEAVSMYKKEYTKLSSAQREELLLHVSKTEWGESFVYEVMNYMFEAMLGDPVYGGNNKEAGWQWLNFKGGQPRPQKVYM